VTPRGGFRVRSRDEDDDDDHDYFPPDDRPVFEYEWLHDESGTGRGGMRWTSKGEGRDFVEVLANHYEEEWDGYTEMMRERWAEAGAEGEWMPYDDGSCSFVEYLDTDMIVILEFD
jgi:hypothetical protein